MKDADKIFKSGDNKISINTAAIDDPEKSRSQGINLIKNFLQ